jgi:hypothetical protein
MGLTLLHPFVFGTCWLILYSFSTGFFLTQGKLVYEISKLLSCVSGVHVSLRFLSIGCQSNIRVKQTKQNQTKKPQTQTNHTKKHMKTVTPLLNFINFVVNLCVFENIIRDIMSPDSPPFPPPIPPAHSSTEKWKLPFLGKQTLAGSLFTFFSWVLVEEEKSSLRPPSHSLCLVCCDNTGWPFTGKSLVKRSL